MARGRAQLLIAALAFFALALTACGGTSSWTWTWVSGDGNTTVDASYDGTAKPLAFTYPMSPPETAADW
ncbi:MAG: hypothetical protein H6806_03800 [Planctomycetes bacterium]|mgnify:CR=1 FL=1|nr:hypothetical protein [Planctomycetota bacterium]MCB9828878.1 hypothetical protein [Planctomycetota bacterium]MCB9902006.1 hypothetical protein [Planctomycetota bacterium]